MTLRLDKVDELLEAPLKANPSPSQSSHKHQNNHSYHFDRNFDRQEYDRTFCFFMLLGHRPLEKHHEPRRSYEEYDRSDHYDRRHDEDRYIRQPDYSKGGVHGSREEERGRDRRRRPRSYSRSPIRPTPSTSNVNTVIGKYPSNDLSYKSEVTNVPVGDQDKRTVFIRQIGQRVTESDVLKVCKEAGPVVQVRLVLDKITRRHKGVAYCEYYTEDSVPKALALTGTKLFGVPLIFELTEAEKNRIAAEALEQQKRVRNSQDDICEFIRIYLESSSPQLDQQTVRRFFSAAGLITNVVVSGGLAQIDFKHSIDAKRAVDQLNGCLLLGNKVSLKLVSSAFILPVASKPSTQAGVDMASFDDEDLSPIKRAELMLKLARKSTNSPQVILRNVFKHGEDERSREDVCDEVRKECLRFGSVLDASLDRDQVVVKMGSVDEAERVVKAMDGRWFSGRQIQAKLLL